MKRRDFLKALGIGLADSGLTELVSGLYESSFAQDKNSNLYKIVPELMRKYVDIGILQIEAENISYPDELSFRYSNKIFFAFETEEGNQFYTVETNKFQPSTTIYRFLQFYPENFNESLFPDSSWRNTAFEDNMRKINHIKENIKIKDYQKAINEIERFRSDAGLPYKFNTSEIFEVDDVNDDGLTNKIYNIKNFRSCDVIFDRKIVKEPSDPKKDYLTTDYYTSRMNGSWFTKKDDKKLLMEYQTRLNKIVTKVYEELLKLPKK